MMGALPAEYFPTLILSIGFLGFYFNRRTKLERFLGKICILLSVFIATLFSVLYFYLK